jgi:hypothetical protein
LGGGVHEVFWLENNADLKSWVMKMQLQLKLSLWLDGEGTLVVATSSLIDLACLLVSG